MLSGCGRHGSARLPRFRATSRRSASTETAKGILRNEAGVQLLSRPLHRQLFGDRPIFPRPAYDAVSISKKHLAKHDLENAANTEVPNIHFDLPPLQGQDLTEHFHNIAYEDCAPYLHLADAFAKATLPHLPDHWQRTPGWTRYEPDGSFHAIAHPPADVAITFDVETMYAESPFAVMAIAASAKAWYGWVSPWLLGETEDKEQLIPMPARSIGASRRVIVGHNVSYDRARILEEYHIEPSGNGFLDTMSLHIARRGLSNPQRPEFLRRRKTKEEQARRAKADADEEDLVVLDEYDAASASVKERDLTPRELANMTSATNLDDPNRPWYDVATTNGLADVVKLHFDTKLNKEPRDLFGPGATREGILGEFHELMEYCATDVLFTHQVYRASFPSFRAACSSPASLSGILHMASPILPVDKAWPRFLEAADAKFDELQQSISATLTELANKERMRVYETPDEHGKRSYDYDPWLSQLDWSAKKMPKEVATAVEWTPEESTGPPRWATATEVNDPSAAILLRVECEGRPLRWRASMGWAVEGEEGELETLLVDGEPLKRIFEQPGRLTYKAKPSAALYKLFLELASSSITQLRALAKDRDLDHRGKTSDLLARLLAASGYEVDTTQWDLKVDDLKAKLLERDLPAQGNKPELVAQLIASTYVADAKEHSPSLKLASPCLEFAAAYDSRTDDTLAALKRRIDELAREALRDPTVSRTDEQLSALDWSTPVSSAVAPDSEEGDTLCPLWYKQLLKKGELHLSLRTRIAPFLFRCSWTGHPLVHSAGHGWLYRYPASPGEFPLGDMTRLDFSNSKDTHLADDEWDNQVRYFKVPHPSGSPTRNVGNPLSKDFAKMIDAGILTAELASARDRLRDHIACSYWTSSNRRIKEQMVVSQRPGRDLGLPESKERGPLGFIVPNVVPMGTVTRRAVESTWLTASNTKAQRVGSEIKSLVRAPPGYAIVGADVDSEELWICSVIGDAQFGFHGATALGWQTLEGTKSAGTDMHSATAKTIGVSRDRAKVFNYSRLYGAGKLFAEQELRKADPLLTAAAARDKANKLYDRTKGRSIRRRGGKGVPVEKVWTGGSESMVFNALEAVALSDDPRTPALGASITEALSNARINSADEEGLEAEASARPRTFMTSRINWVVQSSGVDYLHLLIVGMQHLCRHYGIQARYMLSVHDELRYLVVEKDRYRAALALQIANLWTRAYFAYRLSMDDLPQSCAFFSAVDIDHVLRKETTDPCVTPSQPDAIPAGEALDIGQILEKTGGILRADGRGNSERPPTTKRVFEEATDVPPGQMRRQTDMTYLRLQALGAPTGTFGRAAL